DINFQGEQTDRHRHPCGQLKTGPTCKAVKKKLSGRFREQYFLHMEALENVSDFDIVKVGDTRAALKPGAHFMGVVLEAFQRSETPGIDYHAIAQHADFGIALENAIQNVTARDGAHALYAERIAHFGAAQMRFLEHGLKQSG